MRVIAFLASHPLDTFAVWTEGRPVEPTSSPQEPGTRKSRSAPANAIVFELK